MIFKFCSNLLKAVRVNLKACMGLVLPTVLWTTSVVHDIGHSKEFSVFVILLWY